MCVRTLNLDSDSSESISSENSLVRSVSFEEIASFQKPFFHKSIEWFPLFMAEAALEEVKRDLVLIPNFNGDIRNLGKFLISSRNILAKATCENVALNLIFPFIFNKMDDPFYSYCAGRNFASYNEFKDFIFSNISSTQSSNSIFSKIYALKQIHFSTLDLLLSEIEDLYRKYVETLALENLINDTQVVAINHSGLLGAKESIFSGQINLLFINISFNTFPELITHIKNNAPKFSFLNYNNDKKNAKTIKSKF